MYNQLIAVLPQKWRRQVEKGEGRELVCLPYIKDTNWLKVTGINRKIYQFHLRTNMLTAAPYRLQNKWEELFNATDRMLYIWGIQQSQLCRFCCKETINRSFILVLPLCSLFLVTGSGIVKKNTTCN
jgi:hypothetical protein